MDYNNFYGDLMNQWTSNQKNYFEFLQNSFTPKNQDQSNSYDFYSASAKKNMDFYNEWMKMGYDNFSKLSSIVGQNPASDVMNKIASASELYWNMYNMWKNMNEQAGDMNPQKMQEFYKSWQENYMKILMDNFIVYLPKPLQDIYAQQSSLYNTYYDSLIKFFHPWTSSIKDFQNLLLKGVSGDKNAMIDYINLWKESYQNSIGKLLDMPSMGMYKGQNEQFSQSIDSFTEYIVTIAEYMTMLQKVAYEAMENIVKDYPEMLKNQSQPKTFREFYEYWWKKNEDNYLKLFKTDEFSKLLAKVVDSGINYKKHIDKLIEQQLEALPIATDKDINSLYKTIYDLKKQVKSMSQEITEIKEQLKKCQAEKSKEI